MRIFVTGASGWIGSAVVTELVEAGHAVVGLARSESAAVIVAGLGAEVLRGDLEDLDSLRTGAAASDGVIHLGYNHDFSRMGDAAATDLAAITAIGDALEGTGHPLLIASGVLGLATGRAAAEQDVPDSAAHPRVANAAATLALAERGVRPLVVRFAPTVHGPGDHGFVAVLTAVAREKGVAAYIEDGANRWPAVHRLDAADLVRRAVESAPSGSVLHAAAEEGIPTRSIAEAIGRSLDLPVASIAAADAAAHFGWIGNFFGADTAASSTLTRQLLDWTPAQQGLIADLDAGLYVR
ncbi:MAG TPA: SDR family oxidoreductase [Jatrophihabitans sp.]|jgi:nucleoside-diphosphate-sugar epimerase